MIVKHKDYKNGYFFLIRKGEPKNRNDIDLRNIIKNYKEIGGIKCIICNSRTANNFKITNGYSYITINNKLNDGCFFINRIK